VRADQPKEPRPWLHTVRLRALAIVVAATLAVIGLASVAATPLWPVLGVAVAAVALVVNKMAMRLSDPTCLGCGTSLRGQPHGEHGVSCPKCGSVSDVLLVNRAEPSDWDMSDEA
jgi:tRNA(Ile2) C34 agmatinyltransferase TiaS